MKIFELLNEEDEDPTLRELIERDCWPFLRESKRNGLLFRGIKKPPGDSDITDDGIEYWKKNVRENRRPLGTPKAQQQMYDNWFKKKFGYAARAESMFCVGEYNDPTQSTEQYGKTYIVIPIGEFKYLWSKDVFDLWSEGQAVEGGDQDEINDFMEDFTYRTDGLDEAVKKGYEIMIKCKSYYLLSYMKENTIRKLLGIQ